jgi:KAP family P-loop domain
MLSDRPVQEDSEDELGFKPYADALAELIDSPNTDTPLTIAVSAPWGAGKTSLAKMVGRRLKEWPPERGERPHIVCWFNAWMHEDAPHLGSAFAAEVARTANANRGMFQRLFRPLPTAMMARKQRARRRIYVVFIALAIAILVGRYIPGVFKPGEVLDKQIRGQYGAAVAAIVFGVWLLYGAIKLWGSIAETAASFIVDPERRPHEDRCRKSANS